MQHLPYLRLLFIGLAMGILFSCTKNFKYSSPWFGKDPVKKTEKADSIDLPASVEKALSWLVSAQDKNGGWGAGLSSRQNIRDPHAVDTDPGTTAFACMALLRAGNTLNSGKQKVSLAAGLEYVLKAVEQTPEGSPNITTLQGTQPQAKLGRNIDASLASQFLTRIRPYASHNDKLVGRIENALSKCLLILQQSQNADGTFQGGTWAGVLQDAMSTNALEEVVTRMEEKPADSKQKLSLREDVDTSKLKESLSSSRGNKAEMIDAASGAVSTDKAAGVQLYSYSTTVRTTAREAKRAKVILEKAYKDGELDNTISNLSEVVVNVENFIDAGVSEEEARQLVRDYHANQAAAARVQDEQVLSGFGNNGGEEFLSYMMTSESLCINGGQDWKNWNQKMISRLEKIQNPDGSWSGHHCITSPVFCTSACILTLTVDHDQTLMSSED